MSTMIEKRLNGLYKECVNSNPKNAREVYETSMILATVVYVMTGKDPNHNLHQTKKRLSEN